MEEKCCVNCGCDPVLGMQINESEKKLAWLQEKRDVAEKAQWEKEFDDAMRSVRDEDPKMAESTFGQEDWPALKNRYTALPDRALKGILVFYIDCCQLPQAKAIEFVERCKEQFFHSEEGKARIKQNYELIFVPTRTQKGTKVEYIPLV